MCGTAGKTWRRRPGACREPSRHQRLVSWEQRQREPWAWPTLGAGRADSSSRSCRPQGLQPALVVPPPPRPSRAPEVPLPPPAPWVAAAASLRSSGPVPTPAVAPHGQPCQLCLAPPGRKPQVAPACLPCARAGQQRRPHPLGTASSHVHGVFIGPVSTCVYSHYSFYFYRLFYPGFSLPCTSILYSKSLPRGCVRPGAPQPPRPVPPFPAGLLDFLREAPLAPARSCGKPFWCLHCVDRGSQGNTRPDARVIAPTPCAVLTLARHGASLQGRLGGPATLSFPTRRPRC